MYEKHVQGSSKLISSRSSSQRVEETPCKKREAMSVNSVHPFTGRKYDRDFGYLLHMHRSSLHERRTLLSEVIAIEGNIFVKKPTNF
ncbi:hypothetical protein DM15PD_14380 [Aristophania vespae]|nr:hypothetical protein DM15PD_14380 [Aristophania vespae]